MYRLFAHMSLTGKRTRVMITTMKGAKTTCACHCTKLCHIHVLLPSLQMLLVCKDYPAEPVYKAF